jgi:chorismate mutase
VSVADDTVLAAARERIAAVDARLVELVNERIEHVAELRRHKEATGLPFVDRDREAWLVRHLKELNSGPLSDRGVEELVAFVLGLVKREVARG